MYERAPFESFLSLNKRNYEIYERSFSDQERADNKITREGYSFIRPENSIYLSIFLRYKSKLLALEEL